MPRLRTHIGRGHHAEQPFSNKHSYDAFAPAYRTGYEGYARHADGGGEFEAVEAEPQVAYATFSRSIIGQ
jgi:hypothetical protein